MKLYLYRRYLRHSSGLIMLAFAALGMSHQTGAVPFTDAAGRVVELPETIRRVYPTSPVSAIYVYTIAPETLVGWNYLLSDHEKQYLLPEVRNLPMLGGWFGKNGTANLETLLASKPDVIFSFGALRDTDIDFANRIQSQTGIPVVMGDSRLEVSGDLYRMLGKLLNKEPRAKMLADYCTHVFEDSRKLAALIPEENRPRVYYAEGLKGLETDSDTSMHTESFRHAAANLVYKAKEQSGMGKARISMEQVLLWQPQVIFIGRDKGESDEIPPEWLSNAQWQSLPACRNNRVYQLPNSPFNWMDRPPSINRLIGIRWAFWCLYPEQAQAAFDMVEETRTFFELFYHHPLTEEEALEILHNSKLEIEASHD